jgi:DNA (cytosine-5)-methyltransferase 1
MMSLLRTPSENRRRTLIHLFSGTRGMSFGFDAHPSFRVVAAFDGERNIYG